MAHTLEETFYSVYLKLQMEFYKRIFHKLESREARLSTVETFSIQAIDALGTPTVSEFAKFLDISVANATYKVQSLEKKGYLYKQRSSQDRRESYLHVSERFENYKKLHSDYVSVVIDRVEETCTPEEIEVFKRVMEKINDTLTPEVEFGSERMSA